MDSRPSDEMLLLAVVERDMGAFRALYERHAGCLAIRLARRCNDRFGDHDAASGTSVFDAYRASASPWPPPRSSCSSST